MEQVGGPVAWKACTEQAGSLKSEDEEAGGRLGKLVLTAGVPQAGRPSRNRTGLGDNRDMVDCWRARVAETRKALKALEMPKVAANKGARRHVVAGTFICGIAMRFGIPLGPQQLATNQRGGRSAVKTA